MLWSVGINCGRPSPALDCRARDRGFNCWDRTDFPASWVLSRQKKNDGKERDLCRSLVLRALQSQRKAPWGRGWPLPVSTCTFMQPPTTFVAETDWFSKPVSFYMGCICHADWVGVSSNCTMGLFWGHYRFFYLKIRLDTLCLLQNAVLLVEKHLCELIGQIF